MIILLLYILILLILETSGMKELLTLTGQASCQSGTLVINIDEEEVNTAAIFMHVWLASSQGLASHFETHLATF